MDKDCDRWHISKCKLRPVSQSSYVWCVLLEYILLANCVQELNFGVSRLRAIRLCNTHGSSVLYEAHDSDEERKEEGKTLAGRSDL